MARNTHVDRSYDLDKLIEESIERMRDNVTRSHKVKRAIVDLRRSRRKVEQVPQDVVDWFRDTEEEEEEEE